MLDQMSKETFVVFCRDEYAVTLSSNLLKLEPAVCKLFSQVHLGGHQILDLGSSLVEL